MVRVLALCLLLAAVDTAAQTCNNHMPGYYPDRFADRGDGTVRDRATGLIWQRCDLGQTWGDGACTGYPESLDWQGALQAVETFNQNEAAAGRPADWRLPNLKELASLINFHCSAPAVFDALWDPDSGSGWSYWSATPELRELGSNVNQAWMVDFYLGRPKPALITQATLAVRLVREE